MAQEIKMSAAGLKAMQEELEYLKTVRRKELAEEIKEARSHGDLSENSEYDEAKNTQGLVENRITELDKMIKDGNLAISEMKRLNASIKDEKISADIDRLEDLSAKIFAQVKADPAKLPQIRKFMDYYLPTTLKLLNAYDRMGAQGIDGGNIGSTMQRVESMMSTIVAAFEKQLDMLFGSEAMDISTDITVLENMMKQEGLSSDGGTAAATQDDIKLEL